MPLHQNLINLDQDGITWLKKPTENNEIYLIYGYVKN